MTTYKIGMGSACLQRVVKVEDLSGKDNSSSSSGVPLLRPMPEDNKEYQDTTDKGSKDSDPSFMKSGLHFHIISKFICGHSCSQKGLSICADQAPYFHPVSQKSLPMYQRHTLLHQLYKMFSSLKHYVPYHQGNLLTLHHLT